MARLFPTLKLQGQPFEYSLFRHECVILCHRFFWCHSCDLVLHSLDVFERTRLICWSEFCMLAKMRFRRIEYIILVLRIGKYWKCRNMLKISHPTNTGSDWFHKKDSERLFSDPVWRALFLQKATFIFVSIFLNRILLRISNLEIFLLLVETAMLTKWSI